MENLESEALKAYIREMRVKDEIIEQTLSSVNLAVIEASHSDEQE